MLVWSKSVPASRADIWSARIATIVSPERLAVITLMGRVNVRLEAHGITNAQARKLLQQCGGSLRVLSPRDWQPQPATSPTRHLRISGRLWITGHEDALPALRAAHPGKPVLCIPAAMAFGTGEHATTAMCLRLLAEIARLLPLIGAPTWDILDLGTGSGILALAGRLLGAHSGLGLDNDPHAVRTARGNATRNSVRGVRFVRADLLAGWEPARGACPVITANIFSELLIAQMPRISVALAKGGYLIASGVLASQAEEVAAVIRRSHLQLLTTRRRGKWVAFLATK